MLTSSRASSLTAADTEGKFEIRLIIEIVSFLIKLKLGHKDRKSWADYTDIAAHTTKAEISLAKRKLTSTTDGFAAKTVTSK